MEVVSRRSDSEIQRERVTARVRWAVRELAANLMRVTRGAGKPYEIAQQAAELVVRCEEYCKLVGHYPPSDELANALLDIEERELSGGYRLFDHAKQMMVDGALQIAASRLMGQRTQEAAGQTQMFDGVRLLDEARQEIRKESQRAHTKPVVARRRKSNPARD